MKTSTLYPIGRLLAAVILIIALPSAADDSLAEKTLTVSRVHADSGITVDAHFDEPVWDDADWFSDFRQSVPEYGRKASEMTRVAFAYDAENIYIAVICEETDIENIFATKLRHRDNVRRDDVVEIVLDTYKDNVRGYLFLVNPLGAKDESQINGAHKYNWNWDETWDVTTLQTSGGWQAEFRIPFSILSFATEEVSSWGVNVRRTLKSRNEEVYMQSPPPPFEISSLNYTATLEGFKDLQRQRNVQVIPYALVKGSEDEYGQSDVSQDMGADVKYAVSSDLTLDLTANTDFAQVEADNEQVNLSRYSLFFPEKREFFLENAQLFNFLGGYRPGRSLMPFFSRRIGIYGDRAVPINVGARLSGKLSGNDIGLLTIQTDELADVGLPTGLYNVARLRRNIHGRSYIGGIFTSSSRGDFDSQTYGIDGQWYFNNRMFFSAYYTAVEQSGLEDGNDAYSLTMDYTRDDFGWNVSTSSVGENYQPDLGFVPRRGIQRNSASYRRSWRLKNNLVRRYSVRTMGNWTNTTDGELESSDKTVHFEMEFEAGDKIDVNIQREFEQLFETFSLTENLFFAPGRYEYNTFSLRFSSSPARRWSTNGSYFSGGYFGGNRQDYSGSLAFVISSHLNVSAGYSQYSIENELASLEWKIFRGRVNYIHNAFISASALFQYNSSTGSYITNLRFRWLHSNDSDLFIVFNDEHRENDFNDLELVGREAIVKVNYRFFL